MSIGKWVLQQKHLDLAGVHAALLPSGKVLYFSYFAPEENNVNLAKWQLWQEDQGRSHQKASTKRHHYCSFHYVILSFSCAIHFVSRLRQGLTNLAHFLHLPS